MRPYDLYFILFPECCFLENFDWIKHNSVCENSSDAGRAYTKRQRNARWSAHWRNDTYVKGTDGTEDLKYTNITEECISCSSKTLVPVYQLHGVTSQKTANLTLTTWEPQMLENRGVTGMVSCFGPKVCAFQTLSKLYFNSVFVLW
jgi:hypothetical protein